MLQKILGLIANELDTKETDSEKYKIQSQKCQIIFEEIIPTLDEEQKKKFLNLDFENFMCAGQWKEDGFKEGLESGFKLAIQLVLDSLRN